MYFTHQLKRVNHVLMTPLNALELRAHIHTSSGERNCLVQRLLDSRVINDPGADEARSLFRALLQFLEMVSRSSSYREK